MVLSLTLSGIQIEAVEDLPTACAEADIISSATLSESPLILSKNVKDGTHIDLVGAFKTTMRESDDELIMRATLFADTFKGALNEGGDFAQPLADGVIVGDDVVADLYALARVEHDGRKSDQEVTVFKSTGTALEDLAAAVLAYESI
ncbi:MAG: hypothetical protein JKX81_02380 [Arenicella sp.]|nr:hypothetical protein [Arenicella sp.]